MQILKDWNAISDLNADVFGGGNIIAWEGFYFFFMNFIKSGSKTLNKAL